MKNIKNSNKPSFFKKIFIKISRKLGYEIIDQNRFEIVTSSKNMDQHLSMLGLLEKFGGLQLYQELEQDLLGHFLVASGLVCQTYYQ